MLGDERRPAYAFRTVKGFEQTYTWAAGGLGETDLDRDVPASASRAAHVVDPAAIALVYRARLPGLAEMFEGDGSQMPVMPILDCAIILDGELWLELDDAEPSHLSAGDLVVQQATWHGWRNT